MSTYDATTTVFAPPRSTRMSANAGAIGEPLREVVVTPKELPIPGPMPVPAAPAPIREKEPVPA